MSNHITTHQHVLEDGTVITHTHVNDQPDTHSSSHADENMHSHTHDDGQHTCDHVHEGGQYACGHVHEGDHVHDHLHAGDYGHDHGHDHSHGHTHTHQNTKAVLNRLSKAIGHLESIKRMVESGRDCSEVLVQLAAVKSAINNTGKVILKDHIEHCIVDAIKENDTEALEELNKAIDRFMK